MAGRSHASLVRSYGYDANGNRTSLTGPGLNISGTYDNQDRILTYGTATYSHDRNGFLTEKVVGTDTTKYVYDALGNLLQVTESGGDTIEYVIDAQNRRVGKKVNGTLVKGWLSQLAPAAELDDSGNVVSRFVYATRVNVPDYNMVKGDSTYRLVLDQLGSVLLVVNTVSGSVAQRIDYDEFGRITQDSNAGFQPFGFGGGMYDVVSDLVRFWAREYDGVTGRWAAKDPISFEGDDSNLYAYGWGDPVNVVDVTGLSGGWRKLPTLYAAIDRLRTGREKILTVEDPIEYELAGIAQVPVNEKVGVTFASALRALLRQDPDVMLVGEIRDRETAEIATHAALTGHLVLSTLHTNDAPAALTRLVDLGVPPYLVASTLEGVLAQRLVRVLCPSCRRESRVLSDQSSLMETGSRVFEANGCSTCRGTGYRGRTGIYELMILDEDVRAMVTAHRLAGELRAVARSRGMGSLREDGMRLAREGVTTLQEVLRVTQAI